MEDFDRRIIRYDEESQRFSDELEEIGTKSFFDHLDKFKTKNKVLELKLDRLLKMLKQHAFDPEAFQEDYEGNLSGK